MGTLCQRQWSSEHLTTWNCWIGSMKELAKAFPQHSQRSLFSILNLEDVPIRRISKGSREHRSSGPTLDTPSGATYVRDALLASWCQPASGLLQRTTDQMDRQQEVPRGALRGQKRRDADRRKLDRQDGLRWPTWAPTHWSTRRIYLGITRCRLTS